jgi:hypothetical protein
MSTVAIEPLELPLFDETSSGLPTDHLPLASLVDLRERGKTQRGFGYWMPDFVMDGLRLLKLEELGSRVGTKTESKFRATFSSRYLMGHSDYTGGEHQTVIQLDKHTMSAFIQQLQSDLSHMTIDVSIEQDAVDFVRDNMRALTRESIMRALNSQNPTTQRAIAAACQGEDLSEKALQFCVLRGLNNDVKTRILSIPGSKGYTLALEVAVDESGWTPARLSAMRSAATGVTSSEAAAEAEAEAEAEAMSDNDEFGPWVSCPPSQSSV